MTDVEIVGVDERDHSFEDQFPRFRVYLHGSGASTTAGWTDTYDVTGAGVLQVIDWAQRQAGDSLTFAVALVNEEREPGDGRELVWLVGMDGNDNGQDDHEADAQLRMLARRAAPVVVPAADRIPPGLPDPYNDGTAPQSMCRRDSAED